MLVLMCMLPLTAILVASEAMAASKQPQWPQRSNLNSDLKSASSITLVSMCILPLTAILMAFEAIATSKRPRRPHLTSQLNSVTSITYVAMLLWPLNASMRWLKRTRTRTAKDDPLTCVASPQVKSEQLALRPSETPYAAHFDKFGWSLVGGGEAFVVCGLTFLKDGEKRLHLSLPLILSSFPFHETRWDWLVIWIFDTEDGGG